MDARRSVAIKCRFDDASCGAVLGYRFRAKREQLTRVEGLLPESQGQNLALTVLHVPCSLDIGEGSKDTRTGVWGCQERGGLPRAIEKGTTSTVLSTFT